MPSIPEAESLGMAAQAVPTSTGKGVLIGMLSAFGSAAIIALILLIIYFFQYTQRGRILLDRIGRPGEYDDEQAFIKEEAEALEQMDDMQRIEYQRAKAFTQANPPESVQTDISLSQFLAIQEKGVSAWEFEPELEIANCFVEARTEIEFFDAECSVQSNLPIPKQKEVYYWEAKLYEKPENTIVSLGLTTKPYPLFRLPGWHKYSVAYVSDGTRRISQPFTGTTYGPEILQGDVVGVGYRPRTGTIFFTRNGKKLDDVIHGLKTQNFFPTVGANGPCQVHVNFGQSGFVFIEANVKKWGLAPMTGSLAPPPPYGSEAGSILLEGGRDGIREGQGYLSQFGHARSMSNQIRLGTRLPSTPGPQRSPTDISLAHLSLADSYDWHDNNDVGEGSAAAAVAAAAHRAASNGISPFPAATFQPYQQNISVPSEAPPPDYESPKTSPGTERSRYVSDDGRSSIDDNRADDSNDRTPLLRTVSNSPANTDGPPIPSYAAAMAQGRLNNSSPSRSESSVSSSRR